MKNPLPIIAAVGFFVMFFMMKRRRKKRARSRFERFRDGIEGALDEAEHRSHELTQRAKKLRGDAKKRIEAQAHDVDEHQKELRGRLDDLKSEASKLLERSRA
jgi:F0F1-type ATP synthase membrane subunit b/b'